MTEAAVKMKIGLYFMKNRSVLGVLNSKINQSKMYTRVRRGLLVRVTG